MKLTPPTVSSSEREQQATIEPLNTLGHGMMLEGTRLRLKNWSRGLQTLNAHRQALSPDKDRRAHLRLPKQIKGYTRVNTVCSVETEKDREEKEPRRDRRNGGSEKDGRTLGP